MHHITIQLDPWDIPEWGDRVKSWVYLQTSNYIPLCMACSSQHSWPADVHIPLNSCPQANLCFECIFFKSVRVGVSVSANVWEILFQYLWF